MRWIAAVAGLTGCITIVDGDSPYKFTEVSLTSDDLTQAYSKPDLQTGGWRHEVSEEDACSDADILSVFVTDEGEPAISFELVFPAGQQHTSMPSLPTGPYPRPNLPMRVTAGDRQRFWTGGEVEWTPHVPNAMVVHFRNYWSCDPRDQGLDGEVDLDRCERAELATLVLVGVHESTGVNNEPREDGWVDDDGRPLCGWYF